MTAGIAAAAGLVGGMALSGLIWTLDRWRRSHPADGSHGSLRSGPESREVRQAKEAVAALEARLQEVTAELERSRTGSAEARTRMEGMQAEAVGSAKLAMLGDLVRGVAHEINTPLGALSSNDDVTRRALKRLQVILADEVVDQHELAEVRRIVKAVNGVQETNAMAVERMQALVRNLRTFGRPDRSEIDHVDLHEGLESTLRLLTHQLEDRIRVEKAFGEIPLVECWANEVNQVFMNLLVNAIHAIRDEGTITLRTRRVGDRAVIEVADTGCGIPEENLERIFEPGFTTKEGRVGMGLGLLISSQIVERHGGRLTVASEVGRGTTFTLALPLRLPRAAAAQHAEPAPELTT